jgi:hypothetical protein
MSPTEFLVTHPWLILVGLFISGGLTYLCYAYDEYHWPFQKPPH